MVTDLVTEPKSFDRGILKHRSSNECSSDSALLWNSNERKLLTVLLCCPTPGEVILEASLVRSCPNVTSCPLRQEHSMFCRLVRPKVLG